MTPSPRRWEKMFEYIERTSTVTDVVVSGGDAYMLDPEDLETLGKRLLSIPHIRRIRFGSRGMAFCPGRIIDPEDTWAKTLIRLSNEARNAGKSVALHTHINHPNEINWVTRLAAQRLYQNGVVVRNQAVLLKGVNNELNVLNRLIRELADMNIQPVSVSYHLPSPPTPLASNTICCAEHASVLRIPTRHGQGRRRLKNASPRNYKPAETCPRQHWRHGNPTVRGRSPRRRRKAISDTV